MTNIFCRYWVRKTQNKQETTNLGTDVAEQYVKLYYMLLCDIVERANLNQNKVWFIRKYDKTFKI